MSITTTIKVGESAKTITLPVGQTLTITPTPGGNAPSAGIVYLLDQERGGTNSKQSWAIGSTALAPIGGYSTAQKVLISCTAGSISATVADAVLNLAPITGRGNTAAFVGHSQLANYKTDSSPAVSNLNPWGFASWSLKYSGQAYTVIASPARGGSGITADFAGLNCDAQIDVAIDSGAKFLFYQCGNNDFVNGVPNSLVKAKAMEQWDRALAAGMVVVVNTDFVPNDDATNWTASKRGAMIEFNEWLKQIGRGEVASFRRANFYVYDAASRVVDPVSKTMNMRANGVWTTDKIHTTNVTGQLAGKGHGQFVASLMPKTQLLVTSAADNYGYNALSRNIFDNPLMLDATNGVAKGLYWDTQPASADPTKQPSVVASVVPDPDGYGYAQRGDLTFGIVGDVIRCRTTLAAAGAGNESDKMRVRIQDGDTIIVACKVSARNIVNLRNLSVYWLMNGNTAQKLSTDGIDIYTVGAPYSFALTEGFEGLPYKTLPIKYDAATMGPLNLVNFTVAIAAAGAGGAQVEFSQVSIIKVAT